MTLETTRLLLRQWKEDDYSAFAALNASPEVMRYFPAQLSRSESDALAKRSQSLITERGWGFWAVELKATGQFIGLVGLHTQDENSGIPQAPLVEIGWRLASEFWGKGYASEAAERALIFAFDELNLSSVYAFTALENVPSQGVMIKIGMADSHNDFDHPMLPKGHPLERHCLYKITREQFLAKYE
ncbi:GNAT family N-acetyltransferase [Enterovibrio norvegicus]|uniref:GNAT family N-acetyltransferase n=1 Tax=Enterovibrio norvegicus TaxID=188144 RepID=UPI0024B25833|nr:GNAT family N-acetyltransferase [Enterovibrio norvegicus]